MDQERALVVHPLFVHTLPKDAPRPPQQWESLPAAILHKVATVLSSAQDLTTFEVLSRSCWYVYSVGSCHQLLLPLQLTQHPQTR